jgi:hypothetical protein
VEEKRNIDKFTLEILRGETSCETKGQVGGLCANEPQAASF